jgi:hypothetical protein
MRKRKRPFHESRERLKAKPLSCEAELKKAKK